MTIPTDRLSSRASSVVRFKIISFYPIDFMFDDLPSFAQTLDGRPVMMHLLLATLVENPAAQVAAQGHLEAIVKGLS